MLITHLRISVNSWWKLKLGVLFFFYKSPKEALSQCVLAEVPQQVVNYFSTYKLQPPKNPAAKWMGWAGELRLCACFTCCIHRLWLSRQFCIHVYTHLYKVMSVSFCLQIALPSVPFKGRDCNCVNIWEIGLMWVHFILKSKVEKKSLSMQREEGEQLEVEQLPVR